MQNHNNLLMSSRHFFILFLRIFYALSFPPDISTYTAFVIVFWHDVSKNGWTY